MDTSKAFDKVIRKNLVEDLIQTVDDDELHLLKLLLDDVELTVRCPIFFILYLAIAQKNTLQQ